MTQTMSWGHELWDQYPALSDHTHKGIEFLDKYGQFMKERCAIELEYAGKLRRLAKHHQLKKKDDDDGQMSSCKAFQAILQEMTDLAGQHEIIAENITSNIVKEISIQLKELKEERKSRLEEGRRHMQAYSAALNQLDKAKKAYEKAFKDSEKAREAYEKADADLNLSRAEVEKAKNFSLYRGQICEDCKNEYASQLQKTNDAQRRHFHELMPSLFNSLQDMEERRIASLKSYIKSSAVTQRQVFPIIDKCLEGIIRASESVNPTDDSQLVIDRYKSGMIPPEDIPFEDLSNPTPHPPNHHIMTNGGGSTSSSSTSSSDHHHHSSSTLVNGKNGRTNGLDYSHSLKNDLRGTISMKRLTSRKGILGIFGSSKGMTIDDKNSDDYGELPPVQRRKKIVQKIDQIQASIQQELAVREGLMKMKAAYEANPNMGDPHSVEGQMQDNVIKLDKLEKELKKFQSYLEEIDSCSSSGGKPGTPHQPKKVLTTTTTSPSVTTTTAATTTNNRVSGGGRGSISEDSLSRSASDSSFSQSKALSTLPIVSKATTTSTTIISSSSPVKSSSSIQQPNNLVKSPAAMSSPTTTSTSPQKIKSTNIISQTNYTTITTTSSQGVKTSPTKSSPGHSASTTPTLKTNGGLERSPESGISTSHLSIPDADYVDAVDGDDEDDFVEDLPVLGKARSLYPFEAASEGAINMDESEDLEVVELDQGDGWTRVRRTKPSKDNSPDEGFVPTSYLEIELLDKN